MVAQDVVDFFYGECAVYALDVLELGGDELGFLLLVDFVDEVVGGDVFPINDHVVD